MERQFEIGDSVPCTILKPCTYAPGVTRFSETKESVRVIGHEWGWWLDPPTWIYAIKSNSYEFVLRCSEHRLSHLKIRILGNVAKVISNEKAQAK